MLISRLSRDSTKSRWRDGGVQVSGSRRKCRVAAMPAWRRRLPLVCGWMDVVSSFWAEPPEEFPLTGIFARQFGADLYLYNTSYPLIFLTFPTAGKSRNSHTHTTHGSSEILICYSYTFLKAPSIYDASPDPGDPDVLPGTLFDRMSVWSHLGLISRIQTLQWNKCRAPNC